MNSAAIFNSVLRDFLSELRAQFPQVESIRQVKKKIKGLTKVSPNTACLVFKEKMKPYAELIETRDEEFINGPASDALKKGLGMDMKEIWGLADATARDCIWNYISTLFKVADANVDIPQDALKDIQQIANSVVSKIDKDQLESGDISKTLEQVMSNIDPTAIHSIIKQFDPSMADEMMEGLQSGELMAGLQDMMQNIDPAMIQNMAGMFQGGNIENMDLSKIMSTVMTSMDPNMLKLLGK